MNHSLDSLSVLFVVFVIPTLITIGERKAIKMGLSNFIRSAILGLSFTPHRKRHEILSRKLLKGKW